MRHAPRLLALLALGTFAGSATAGAQVRRIGPPPAHPGAASAAAPSAADTASASLLAVERRFAEAAARVGVRDAFLQFVDDSAVAFTPEPANAKQVWQARRPTNIRLSWTANFSFLSQSRDLGVNTGPYTVADSTGTVVGAGTFMTVWRRGPNGWRFVVDQGTQHAVRPLPDGPGPDAPPVSIGIGHAWRPVHGSAAEKAASLLAADSAFADTARAKGFGYAFGHAADRDVRLLRPNAFPVVGYTPALAAAMGDKRTYTATPIYGQTSFAGDLGWTWGEYQYLNPGAGRRESGHYVRVWRRDVDMRWRVLLNVDSPRPSERDE
jgi:hypothetical protein